MGESSHSPEALPGGHMRGVPSARPAGPGGGGALQSWPVLSGAGEDGPFPGVAAAPRGQRLSWAGEDSAEPGPRVERLESGL